MIGFLQRFQSPVKYGRNADAEQKKATGYHRRVTTEVGLEKASSTRARTRTGTTAEFGERVVGEPGQERRLLTFLTKSILEKEEAIQQKESDLECPVCLEIPTGRIFSCERQHLICSSCKPRVAQCPVCRKCYPATPIRHRYAERSVHELDKLRLERIQLKKEKQKLK